MKITLNLSKSGACPDTGLCPGCQSSLKGTYPPGFGFWIDITQPYRGIQEVAGSLLYGSLPTPANPSGGVNAGALMVWNANGELTFPPTIIDPIPQPLFSIDDDGDWRTLTDTAEWDTGTILGLNDFGNPVAGCTSNEFIL